MNRQMRSRVGATGKGVWRKTSSRNRTVLAQDACFILIGLWKDEITRHSGAQAVIVYKSIRCFDKKRTSFSGCLKLEADILSIKMVISWSLVLTSRSFALHSLL